MCFLPERSDVRHRNLGSIHCWTAQIHGPQLTVGQTQHEERLTGNDSIVGSLDDCTVKLDDVTVAEDAEDLCLRGRHTGTKGWQLAEGKPTRFPNWPMSWWWQNRNKTDYWMSSSSHIWWISSKEEGSEPFLKANNSSRVSPLIRWYFPRKERWSTVRQNGLESSNWSQCTGHVYAFPLSTPV